MSFHVKSEIYKNFYDKFPFMEVVNDTTTSETIKKGNDSSSQLIADEIILWSSETRVQLNSYKS